MATGSKLKLSDFVMRRAEASDYGGVMAISDGIYFGRDIIPSVYHEYLRDPNRVFYVALLQGKVAAFIGGRIIDNGETYEGEGVRTDQKLRGTGLYLHDAVRKRVLQDVLTKWPSIKRIRIVTVSVQDVLRRPDLFEIFPSATRFICEPIWDMPKGDFLQRLAALGGKLWYTRLPLHDVTTSTRTDITSLFQNASTHRRLFPSGFIVRDSQSFKIGSDYLSNVPLIFGDRLHAMFMTRSSPAGSDGAEIMSLSFGTGIESDVPRYKLRYCVDYYGEAKEDVIKSHIYKHIYELPALIAKSRTTETVIFHFFLPKYVYDVVDCKALERFVTSELGFGVTTVWGGVVEQCVANERISPREWVSNSKL